MTLGFAFVAALVYLAWLLERGVAARAGARALDRAARRGSRVSGHDGGRPRLVLDDASSPTGCTSRPPRSGSAGSCALAVALWPAAPQLRRQAFLRFSRLATVLVALVLAAGTYLALVRVPHLARPLDDRATARCCWSRSRSSAPRSPGARVHHFLVRAAARAGRATASSRAWAEHRRARAWSAIAVLLVAAVLVDSKPPPRPSTAPGQPGGRRGAEQLAQPCGVVGRGRLPPRGGSRRRRARAARPRARAGRRRCRAGSRRRR